MIDPVTFLLRSILALGRRLRAERPPGSLSLSGLGILGTLHRQGTLVATRLAAEERLQPQSLTRLLIDLERDRLITRKRSEVDRREIAISITAKGRQTLIEDMAARRAWLQAAMSNALTAPERETMLAASRIMSKLACFEPAAQGES
jgi:DNA-binding MarR family transcriptional regulator